MGAWLIGTFVGILSVSDTIHVYIRFADNRCVPRLSLQGVAYHQTYHYFRLYPKDPRYLKLWVRHRLVFV